MKAPKIKRKVVQNASPFISGRKTLKKKNGDITTDNQKKKGEVNRKEVDEPKPPAQRHLKKNPMQKGYNYVISKTIFLFVIKKKHTKQRGNLER